MPPRIYVAPVFNHVEPCITVLYFVLYHVLYLCLVVSVLYLAFVFYPCITVLYSSYTLCFTVWFTSA
jgi:hypothetical protein